MRFNHLPTLRLLREEISKFDAVIILEGINETITDKMINALGDENIRGYKMAVSQILEMIDDLILAETV